MARTVRDAKLESKAGRAALKAAGKPYYRAIEQGLHLGYRKGKVGGKWVMRTYTGNQGYTVETIGTADDASDSDGALILSYPQAQTLARKMFSERGRVAAGLPAVAGPYTVELCLHEYVTWLTHNGKTAADTRWRADALILPQLGTIECAKLTSKKLTEWLQGVANAPPRVRTANMKAQRFRQADPDEDPEEAVRRRQASANRVLTILKAALNRAWCDDRKIPSDEAWRAVKAYREADAARVRYLTVAEGTRLINAAEPEFRKLVEAALMTGARFGELAALEVADFHAESGTVHVRKSKSRKTRHIVLTSEGVEFFRGLCAGRSNRERMLLKDAGTRWAKSHQSRPMRNACAAATIEPTANFNVLRHTYASHTVMGGAPLMVVAKNLGHVDTRMVEKHYGHMSKSYVADAIRAAAPRFGLATGNVVAL